MLVNVSGKRVLVTASSDGIGKGVARKFLSEGATVLITSRDEAKLRNAYEELRKVSPQVFYRASDLTDLKSLDSLYGFAKEAMGGVDVLIFNTGNPPNEPSYFAQSSDSDWDYAISLYLKSAIHLTRLVLDDMVERKWGRVIYLSSWTVKQPQSHFVLADVSRASLTQLAKILAKEYSRFNVTFNVVRLGSFRTPGAMRGLERLAKEKGIDLEDLVRQEVIERSAVKRFADPEEDLGSFLVFLASDKASYITGSTIDFDGGTSDCV